MVRVNQELIRMDDIMGEQIQEKESIVIDTKWRRVENERNMKIIEWKGNNKYRSNIDIGPKNLQKAGPRSQARLNQ